MATPTSVLLFAALLAGAAPAPAPPPIDTSDPARRAEDPPLPAADAVVRTIAFGSGNRERGPQDHWPVIAAHEPDLFLLIGDNVHADIQPGADGRDRMAPAADRAQIQKAWYDPAGAPAWQEFRRTVPFLATWDDHDYGADDQGRHERLREASQEVFLDFCRVAKDSPRRELAGVYHARTFGPAGQRVQVTLLDTRFHRDDLDPKPADDPRGPYQPTSDTTRSMLGSARRTWLQASLREPADLRIIARSVEVAAWEHASEGWGTMPHERRRLFDLIGETEAAGVVFIGGDRHLVEVSRSLGEDGTPVPYPMWDFTSSGLNEPGVRRIDEPDRFRQGPALRRSHFGLLRIDWDAAGGPVVRFEGRGRADEPLLSSDVPLATLTPAATPATSN